MKYIICGGSGFLGRELTEYWLEAGHQIISIGRKLPADKLSHPGLSYLTWDSLESKPEAADGADALINLAGASLSQRWTQEGKQAIINSRLETVAAAGNLLSSLQHKPQVVIQSSAVAIYGTSLQDSYNESSPTRVIDFPSEVVQTWEAAADEAYTGVRLVKLRTGVVLGNESGAFPKMKLPYTLGFGGTIGSGKQWLSWIHLTDIVRLIDFCVLHPEVEGPVNATAPQPVTNEQFGRLVGKVYHRPHWFPIPAFPLKAAVGELAAILLEGQRVLPSKAIHHGFTFTYPTLQPALEHLKAH